MFIKRQHVPRRVRLPGREKICRQHYMAGGIFYAEDKAGEGYYLVSVLHLGKLCKLTKEKSTLAGEYLCFAKDDFPLLLIELRDELWYLWHTNPGFCRHLMSGYDFPPGILPQSRNLREELFSGGHGKED